MALQAIRYCRGSLELLDQRLLPLTSAYVPCNDCAAAHAAILAMLVRGAPAIAIAAALALAVELSALSFDTGAAAAAFVAQRLAFLVTSRPTAVNLAEIAARLGALAAAAAADGGAAVVAAVVAAAEGELEADVATNRRIGAHGLAALTEGRDAGCSVRVLTHCNTGSLATAGYGTALGVVRALAAAGRLGAAFCTETRPYNQGARLTAFELVHDGLTPATLVTDSAAAALMASGAIDAVVVGADRVARNGDTANKIGTYALAVAAAHHSLPFYVAAPCTTLDPATVDGRAIAIEQRPAEEVTHFRGEQVAAPGIGVWNPGFDVTPARLISGIITEKGVLRPRGGAFDVAGHLDAAAAVDFGRLDTGSVLAYCASQPALAARLGGGAADWAACEIGDGNINFVYRVAGPAGALILKQALPFIRLVGASWPLGAGRLGREAGALREGRRCCPAHVPELYSYDAAHAVLAMEYLAPPHVVLRGALGGGAVFPLLALHVGELLACTLFRTSALALGPPAARAAAAAAANGEMCALTEQVVFGDPYWGAPLNAHTAPHLDADVAALHADAPARAAAARLRAAFVEKSQALLHGDLHTGSLMVTQASTFAIDPEFAFYGPMGFDLGLFLGNLLLAFFAADGAPGDRTAQRAWLLTTCTATWAAFAARFCQLWAESLPAGGEALSGAALAAEQGRYISEIQADALGFAGAEMVRRVVGIAHVADLSSIADVELRAKCERRALRFGRRLLVGEFGSVEAAVAAAAAAREG